MTDLACRAVQFLVEQGPSSAAAVGAALGVDEISAARVLAALTVPPTRVERIAPPDGQGHRSWWWRAAGHAPTAGPAARAAAAAADAIAADETRAVVKARNGGAATRGRAVADAEAPLPAPGDFVLRSHKRSAAQPAQAAAPGPRLDRRREAARERIIATLRAHGPLTSGRLLELSGAAHITLKRLDADGATWLTESRVIPGLTRTRLYWIEGQDIAGAVAALTRHAADHPRRAGGASRTAPAIAAAADAGAAPPRPAPTLAGAALAAVRACCEQHVPQGAWGLHDRVLLARAAGAFSDVVLAAALADPAFGYRAVVRHGLTFVVPRSDAAGAA